MIGSHLLMLHLTQVSIVALIVWSVTQIFFRRRSHVSHALWALVLLKCVTPPIFQSPIGFFSWSNQLLNANVKNGIETLKPSPMQHSAAGDFAEIRPPTVRVVIPLNRIPPASHAARVSRQGNRAGEHELSSFLYKHRILATSLSISLVFGIYFAMRLGCFLFRVHRLARQQSDQIIDLNLHAETIAKGLAQRLGVKRGVRVSVLDATIGPAIVGLIWPRILLPKIVVENARPEELQALLAHELIHFRRGDLWWSTLQAFALALTWCNPLTWLASKRFSQEAENCCDEETVASLNIAPATYARCLLTVLEHKQTLRAAPLLPGVKPVDVTVSRLERIMRFGQGSHSRCPRWISLLLLIGAILVLPCASDSTAQEGKKNLRSPSSTPTESGEVSTGEESDSDQETVASTTTKLDEDLRAFVNSKQLEELGYFFESVSASGALEKLHEEGCTDEQAREKLQNMMPLGEFYSSKSKTTIHGLTIQVVNPDGGASIMIGGEHPAARIVGDKLYILGTRNDIDTAKETLLRMQEFGSGILKYTVRIMEIPTEQLLDSMQDWQVLGRTQLGGNNEVVSAIQVDPSSDSESNVVVTASATGLNDLWSVKTSGALQDEQIRKLISMGEILSAPKLTGHNGVPIELMVGSEVPYVTGFETETDDNGNTITTNKQKIEFATAGIRLRLLGLLDKQESEIDLDMVFEQSDVKDVNTFTFNTESGPATIQMPVINGSKMQTNCKLPVDQTIAICASPIVVESAVKKSVPILGKIPLLGRAFSSTTTSSKLVSRVVLIECSVIDGESETTKSVTSSASLSATPVSIELDPSSILAPATPLTPQQEVLPQPIPNALPATSPAGAQLENPDEPTKEDAASLTPEEETQIFTFYSGGIR